MVESPRASCNHSEPGISWSAEACASPSSRSTRTRATGWWSRRTVTSFMPGRPRRRIGGANPAAWRSSPVATSSTAEPGSGWRAPADGRSSPTCASRAPVDPRAPSRGMLVPTLLRDRRPVGEALHALVGAAQDYNGFNLVAGDRATAAFGSNRGPSVPRSAPVFTASPMPVSTRRGRNSSAPSRASPAGWRRGVPNSIASGRCSPTRRPLPTTNCRTPALRASASACCRRRSS